MYPWRDLGCQCGVWDFSWSSFKLTGVKKKVRAISVCVVLSLRSLTGRSQLRLGIFVLEAFEKGGLLQVGQATPLRYGG